MNRRENQARQDEVNELTITLEVMTRQLPPQVALAAIRSMTDEQWRACAIISGKRPPYNRIKSQVVERFVRHAADQAVDRGIEA